MRELQYIPAVDVPAIELDGPVAYVGAGGDLRGRQWKYDMGYRDLLSTTRPAREVQFSLYSDAETANAFRRAADADTMAKTPGVFVAQDEWRQRGYVVSSALEQLAYGQVFLTINAVLLDGAWWRLASREIRPGGSQGGDYGYLDYNVDYLYDYMHEADTSSIQPSVLTPSPVKLVIYGPASNPYVVVGGNTYRLTMTVPAGGYVTVDGKAKTIVLTRADGSTEDAFAAGARGTGEGGGEYVFEPIPAGRHAVSWPGEFGFTLGWYEEEGEPPWSQF